MEKTKKITVLYIDDEVHNLNSFKATFRFDYNVLLAQNVEEAYAQLNNKENNIQIVLSDQRMPQTTGVAFFEQIRKTHPSAIRMLITGFTDIESVIEAVNRGHIFRYIKKPWVDIDIQSAIEEAYKFFMATSLLDEKSIELQKAYNELNKFAYSVAHDLKGPLVSIAGALDIIKESDVPKESNELIGMITASLKKLQGFVDSMFDYYRLNQGELMLTEVDFTELAQYYTDVFSLESKLNKIELNISVEQTKPFRSDISKLKIILNNLLSNSFKYQQHTLTNKYVHLDIKVTGEMLSIRVADNGIGIDEQYQNSIFDMFYRATSHSPGSGFGLYNTKDAIHKLDGTLTVQSKLNEGSVFTVTIPTK